MNLVITRHGETEDNFKGIFQGHSESPLSEAGKDQAKSLAERFKDRKIDVIYSSDLSRARDTAKEVQKYHLDTPLHEDVRIRERMLGELEGNPFDMYEDLDFNNLPESCETSIELFSRVSEFFDEIYTFHKGKTVFVVCHGGLKRAFLSVIHNKPVTQMEEWGSIGNTAVSEFTIEDDGNHIAHCINCTKHLDDEAG